MVGVLTAFIMIATGWCLCETHHQFKRMKVRREKMRA